MDITDNMSDKRNNRRESGHIIWYQSRWIHFNYIEDHSLFIIGQVFADPNQFHLHAFNIWFARVFISTYWHWWKRTNHRYPLAKSPDDQQEWDWCWWANLQVRDGILVDGKQISLRRHRRPLAYSLEILLTLDPRLLALPKNQQTISKIKKKPSLIQ